MRDTAALQQLERQLIAFARVHREDVEAHLRLGFVALRLGELAGGGHLDNAASEFEWARDLDAGSAVAWYGLGLAELRAAPQFYDARVAAQAMLGREPLDRAARAFREALTRDPGLAPAARGLGEVALARRLDPTGDGALEALRMLPHDRGRDPATMLVRGRVERRFGSADSAAAAFRAVVATGRERGTALLELARTLLAQDDTAGGSGPYYSGARFDDPATVAAYRADLAFIASPEALATFDSLRGGARAEWLGRFWAERDAVALRAAGSRLAEHYRRLARAQREFLMPPFRRRYAFGDYFRPEAYTFDDRGAVYVRHGEPSERARTPRHHSEIWAYLDADPAFTLFFTTDGGMDDYVLRPTIYHLSDAAREDLLGSSRALARMVMRAQTASAMRRARAFAEGREAILASTTTDSHRRRFRQQLPLRGHAVATSVPGRGGTLHVSMALPRAALEAAGYGPGSNLRFRVSVLHGDHGVVAFRDQQVAGAPRGEVVTYYTEVPVPPGPVRWRLGMALDDTIGAELPLGATDVPDAAHGTLALSDLVLGWARTGVRWQPAPGDTVWMNPLGYLPRGEALDLYHEVYGLLAGEQYGGQIVVWRLAEDDPPGVPPLGEEAALRLRFTETATGPVSRVIHTVDVRALRPGRYGLAVVLEDQHGRPAARVAELLVAED